MKGQCCNPLEDTLFGTTGGQDGVPFGAMHACTKGQFTRRHHSGRIPYEEPGSSLEPHMRTSRVRRWLCLSTLLTVCFFAPGGPSLESRAEWEGPAERVMPKVSNSEFSSSGISDHKNGTEQLMEKNKVVSIGSNIALAVLFVILAGFGLRASMGKVAILPPR